MTQKISRHQDRIKAMSFIYENLLKSTIDQDFTFNYEDLKESNFLNSSRYALENLEDLSALIQESLYDWKFERLGFVEQAILLLACGEAVIEASPKQVIIDEAIELAKEYCDEDSFKLINATLDKVLDI